MDQRNWKRSNVSTFQVLAVFAVPHEARGRWDGRNTIDELSRQTGAPYKVCLAAAHREADAGRVTYGGNIRSGWLDDEGIDWLRQHHPDTVQEMDHYRSRRPWLAIHSGGYA